MHDAHAILKELLGRLCATQGAAVKIASREMDSWGADAVAALKAARLLIKAQPVFHTECPGCGRHCFKPVEVSPAESDRPARIFVVCDEPEDFGPIHLEPDVLDRWQITGDLLADALSRMLRFTSPPRRDDGGNHWVLGSLKGSKNTADITLAIVEDAVLLVARHSMPVAQVITFNSSRLSVALDTLRRLVDTPANESLEERLERICRRIEELRAQGIKGFLQQVAKEEDRSVSRIKQLRKSLAESKAGLRKKKSDK